MINRILVPLDGSGFAECALPHAAALALAYDAEVLLLRVLAHERRVVQASVDSADWRLRRREAAAYLDALAEKFRSQGLKARAEVAEGSTEEQIIGMAWHHEMDLIALSSHGRSGPSDFSLGGTAAKVLARAGISVLVVRCSAEPMEHSVERRLEYGSVMVAVDCSQRSDWALHLASTLARSNGAQLVIAHVVPVPQLVQRQPGSAKEARLVEKLVRLNREASEGYLEEMASKIAAPDLEVRISLVVESRVAQTIDELAVREKAGLVVVSAHGASGGSPWPYGSVAGSLIAYGKTPLLIFQDVARKETEQSAPALGAVAYTGNGWSR
jgi:nucleotide-binding universal stress UspA family protein